MNKQLFVLFPLVAMLLLTACTPSQPAKTYLIPATGSTQPAATATAADFSAQVLPTLIPSAANAPEATLAPSATPINTPTIIPTLPPTPTATTALVTANNTCNFARFIGDVTIPDGTVLDPGTAFTKTWELQNVGTCTWTTGYQVVFASGDLMNGPTLVSLTQPVAPGGTVDISVDLVAPTTAGTYQGNWMLRDPSGDYFGTGADASQRFWANIVVGSSADFAVTSADVTVNASAFNGVCPATFWFSSNIYTNAAGTVTYYWIRSDGSRSPEGTLTFTAAGYQAVSDSWTLGADGTVYSGSDQLYIDAPNHQAFGAAYFALTCASAAPTATVTNTPAPTATATAKPTVTNTPAPTATAKPTATHTSRPTAAETAKPTATNPPLPTATHTPTPKATATR